MAEYLNRRGSGSGKSSAMPSHNRGKDVHGEGQLPKSRYVARNLGMQKFRDISSNVPFRLQVIGGGFHWQFKMAMHALRSPLTGGGRRIARNGNSPWRIEGGAVIR